MAKNVFFIFENMYILPFFYFVESRGKKVIAKKVIAKFEL